MQENNTPSKKRNNLFIKRLCSNYDFGKKIEPAYNIITDGEWLSDEPYGVIHRIASDGSEKGIGTFCINWVFDNCKHIRIDTHKDNKVMQNLLNKLGFKYCGIINLPIEDGERVAYEKEI